MKELKVKNCHECVFESQGYCNLNYLITGKGLYVKNEWRKETTSQECQLLTEGVTITHEGIKKVTIS